MEIKHKKLTRVDSSDSFATDISEMAKYIPNSPIVERQKDPAYAERESEQQWGRKRELRKDLAYKERLNEKLRQRYQNDPDYAERQKKRQR